VGGWVGGVHGWGVFLPGQQASGGADGSHQRQLGAQHALCTPADDVRRVFTRPLVLGRIIAPIISKILAYTFATNIPLLFIRTLVQYIFK
jgi:hypothetical protein